MSDFVFAPFLFEKVLAACWPWALATRLFLGLRRGRSCDGGLGFIPERGKQSHPPSGGWQCDTIVSLAEQDVAVTVFFDNEGLGLVHCSCAVFGSASDVHSILSPAVFDDEARTSCARTSCDSS